MTLPDNLTKTINETNTVAFISDGKVVQIDKMGVYYAAVLTSDDVTVVDVTNFENVEEIVAGSIYDSISKTFTTPII